MNQSLSEIAAEVVLSGVTYLYSSERFAQIQFEFTMQVLPSGFLVVEDCFG